MPRPEILFRGAQIVQRNSDSSESSSEVNRTRFLKLIDRTRFLNLINRTSFLKMLLDVSSRKSRAGEMVLIMPLLSSKEKNV